MKQQLSKNAVKVWRMRTALVFFVIMFLSGGIFVFSQLISLCVVAADIAGFLFAFFIAVPYVYKNTVLEVRKDGITIKKGVLMQKRMNILAKKIQYVELLQTPIQRYYKVYTVALHTAGATVFISQVDMAQSQRFRKYHREE